MVEEFESSWRTLTPGRTGYLLQTSPFDGILRFTKMVKPAVEAARAEARGHVEMLHAANKCSEATLVAQRIAACSGCLPLRDNATIVDLQTLARLSENQEDFVAAEHYQSGYYRLQRLSISLRRRKRRWKSFGTYIRAQSRN